MSFLETQALPVVEREGRIMVTRERLKEHNACSVGYAFFVRACRKYGRQEFELQELLDVLANATPIDDPEGLAYWYAHWLLATLGYYASTIELDSLDAPGCVFTAGNLVVRRSAKVAGRLIAGGHVSVSGHLDANHIQIAGALSVGGDIRSNNRVEATVIHAGGDLESRHSFIHADKGDVTAGGRIFAATEVSVDAGTVRCAGDLICGDGVYAKGQEIGGVLRVLNLPRKDNYDLPPPPIFPLAPSLNRAARRAKRSKGKASITSILLGSN